MNKRIIFLTSVLVFLVALILLSQNGVFATEISQIEITGLSEPVVGMKQCSLATVADDADYTVMFEEWWKEFGGMLEEDEKFEKGVKYSYAVYIKAKDNFTFADNATATIDGKPLTLDRTYGDSIVFTLDYGLAKEIPLVSEIEITDVTMPVAGQKPTYTGKISEDANYKLNNEFWYDKNGKEVTEKFEEGKTYTYNCIVNTINNYTFGDDVTATVNGNDMNFESNEGNLLVFSYKFKVEESETLKDNEATDEKEDELIYKKDETPKTGTSLDSKTIELYISIVIILSVAYSIKNSLKNK